MVAVKFEIGADELTRRTALRPDRRADDHALVRAGLRSLIERIEDVVVIGEAGEGHEALRLIEQLQPHVALVDITMPGLNGIDVIESIKPGEQLQANFSGEAVETLLDGSFIIHNVTPGTYYVIASKQGYIYPVAPLYIRGNQPSLPGDRRKEERKLAPRIMFLRRDTGSPRVSRLGEPRKSFRDLRPERGSSDPYVS